MYRYDSTDQQLIDERVAQYRGQIARHLAGELSDDELRPLRLQNGLYIQRHGPMLRIAIPYGMLSSAQLRKLAEISRRYDRASGTSRRARTCSSTGRSSRKRRRSSAELASVEMHAVQTSGNCIRNITSDHFAGVAADELTDPRPYCELLRQWSTFHPEFAFLPRKFKIAVNAAAQDRAVIRAHDIGLDLVSDERGELGFRVFVGGGWAHADPRQGGARVPAAPAPAQLPRRHLRLYNRYGRRDNMYKARIKILVKALGHRGVRAARSRPSGRICATARRRSPTPSSLASPRISRRRPGRRCRRRPRAYGPICTDKAFANWVKRCVHAHKTPGYAAVTLSLKAPGVAPGDISDVQMIAVADLADRFSFGELRVSHEQNVVLADVKPERPA
jgi:sulfite reductase (NADPH) hemoprotein beta-component